MGWGPFIAREVREGLTAEIGARHPGICRKTGLVKLAPSLCCAGILRDHCLDTLFSLHVP